MAQSYFPTRVASPVKEAFHDSVFAVLNGDRQLKIEDVQEAYIESKDRCVDVFKVSCRPRLTVHVDW
jgi:mitofusin